MKIFPKPWQLGDWSGIKYMIADKGYDYAAVRIPIKKAEKIPVIPRKVNAIFSGFTRSLQALLPYPSLQSSVSWSNTRK